MVVRSVLVFWRSLTEKEKVGCFVYRFCFVWSEVLRPSQQLWLCSDGQLA